MIFYDKKEVLYLESGTLAVGLRAVLVQVKDRMSCSKDTVPEHTILKPGAFVSKRLSSAKTWYSNMERELLGILHGLEKFYHYCFAIQLHVITDHKPPVLLYKILLV